MENYTQMGGNRECTHIQTKMYQLKYLGKCKEVYDFLIWDNKKMN